MIIMAQIFYVVSLVLSAAAFVCFVICLRQEAKRGGERQ